jgi:hypothetical protein
VPINGILNYELGIPGDLSDLRGVIFHEAALSRPDT